MLLYLLYKSTVNVIGTLLSAIIQFVYLGEIGQVLRSILNNESVSWNAFITYVLIYRSEINFWNDWLFQCSKSFVD